MRPRLVLSTARCNRRRELRESQIASKPHRAAAGMATAASTRSYPRQRETATASGNVASDNRPVATDHVALARPGGAPLPPELLLGIGATNRGRGNRAADDTGDRDEGQDVG